MGQGLACSRSGLQTGTTCVSGCLCTREAALLQRRAWAALISRVSGTRSAQHT